MKSRLLVITLAVVLALVGIVAVLAYVRGANDRAINGLKAETVMVATAAIPAGTSLSAAQQDRLLGTEEVPDSSLTTPPVQSVTTTNEHLVLSGTVAKGQVLLQNMLASAGSIAASANAAVLPLPTGDIGVTMEMCLDADVAGYVQPGSYIAVFDTVATGGQITYSCTSHQPPNNPGHIYTTVVVARIQVLSVTPAGSQSTSSASGSANADTNNPASGISSAGEVLVTLAATSQAEAENLIAINSTGYAAFGLLAKGSRTNADDPFVGGGGAINPLNPPS